MYGIATVITIPSMAWTAVATAIVLDLTLVADTSQRITKQTGPREQPVDIRQHPGKRSYHVCFPVVVIDAYRK